MEDVDEKWEEEEEEGELLAAVDEADVVMGCRGLPLGAAKEKREEVNDVLMAGGERRGENEAGLAGALVVARTAAGGGCGTIAEGVAVDCCCCSCSSYSSSSSSSPLTIILRCRAEGV